MRSLPILFRAAVEPAAGQHPTPPRPDHVFTAGPCYGGDAWPVTGSVQFDQILRQPFYSIKWFSRSRLAHEPATRPENAACGGRTRLARWWRGLWWRRQVSQTPGSRASCGEAPGSYLVRQVSQGPPVVGGEDGAAYPASKPRSSSVRWCLRNAL